MKSRSIEEALHGFYAYMSRPLELWVRPVLALLVLPLAIAVSQPFWNIRLEAPQYPEGLAVDVYTYTLRSGHGDKDLGEINVLNHYVGMHKIDRAAFAELDWLPFGFGVIGILLLRVAAIGDVRGLLDLAVITLYFAGFSAGRFVYKMWYFGHDLSPEAPVKVPPFMPALFGSKQIGNFTTHAGPALGTYLFGVVVVAIASIALVQLYLGRKRSLAALAAAGVTGGM